MGDLNIHNKSKSGHIKQEYFLDKALSLGNKSHYRNILGAKYYPDINLVFPTGNLTYCIDDKSKLEDAKLPVIIRSQDTSVDLTNYKLYISRAVDKNFVNSDYIGEFDLVFHTDLSAYYTATSINILQPAIEGPGYIPPSLPPFLIFKNYLNIYIQLRLNLPPKLYPTSLLTEYGPSLICNFSVTFKLAQVVNGLLFPDISSFNTFYEEGKFFDGNVYYY